MMIALTITSILLFLNSMLLIAVVLVQNPKDEGGNILAGNNEMKQLVGVAQMPHLLYKITYFLLTALFLLTLLFSSLLGSYYGINSVLMRAL